MTARLLVPIFALLAPALAGAQPADPVSGNWGQDGATYLELKYDGKHAVTGTAVWRGNGQEARTPITSGTFDPKTRALTLEGEGKTPEGVVAKFLIKGTIEGDVVSGTFRFGPGSGDFRFKRLAVGALTPEQLNARLQAHKGDFDYLLGDWEFTSDSKEYGKGRGVWSAVRLDEGQVLDEYRVVGDNGETYYVTTTLRNYNKAADRWELVGADAGAGLQDFGTGRRAGDEMHIEQTFGAITDRPTILRIRYYNIQKDRFSWSADRSIDGGKTWEKNHLQIEARRTGPARSLGALAPARKSKN